MFDFKEVILNTRAYKTSSTNRITEKSVSKFYESIGYTTFFNYKKLILEFSKALPLNSKLGVAGIRSISDDIVNLFLENRSGYPDLLLIKNGEMSFVEIKINKDSLGANQYDFILKLMEYKDVTVAWFYNTGDYNSDYIDNDKKYLSDNEFLINEYKNDIKFFLKLQKNKKYKFAWVIVKLLEKHQSLVYRKEYVEMLSLIANIEEEFIFNYAKENLGKVLINKKYNNSRVDDIGSKKERYRLFLKRKSAIEKEKLSDVLVFKDNKRSYPKNKKAALKKRRKEIREAKIKNSLNEKILHNTTEAIKKDEPLRISRRSDILKIIKDNKDNI